MSIEAGVLLDDDDHPLFWHLPADRTAVALPDSPSLWTEIWQRRNELSAIAHSHPGGGKPRPSNEDVTTFSAIELGLGKRLDWYIVNAEGISMIKWEGPGKYAYNIFDLPMDSQDAAMLEQWVPELRKVSGITKKESAA